MPFKKGEIPKGANIFPKGTSGNPNGRPKGIRSRKTIYREIAELALKDIGIDIEELDSKTNVATATAIQMFRRAIVAADVAAAKEAMDSAFGKVAERVIDETPPKKLVLVVRDGDIPEPDDDEPATLNDDDDGYTIDDNGEE